MIMEFRMASGGRRGEPVIAVRLGGQEEKNECSDTHLASFWIYSMFLLKTIFLLHIASWAPQLSLELIKPLLTRPT